MKDVQLKLLRTAIAQLSVLPVKFAIIDDEGNKHGDLEISKKKERVRAKMIHPRGLVTDYVLPFLKDLKVGEVATIPYNQLGKKSITSGATAVASRIWGNGSYTSHASPTTNYIEILRVGGREIEEKYAAPKK
jgi:hypothetical protein